MTGRSRAEQDLRRRIRTRRREEAAIQLDVVILGDGRGAPGFEKRLEVRERLSEHRFVAAVTIPEILYDAYPEATPDEVERSAIQTADVIICLESPLNPPLGMYTEVRTYLDFAAVHKWYLLQPSFRDRTSEDEALVAGLARSDLDLIESQDYEPGEWERCDRITRLCAKRIELMVNRRLRWLTGLAQNDPR